MTNQEKMQKIYEATGIEPKWWSDNEVLYPTQEPEYESSKPHYPIEQLWDMLPDRITKDRVTDGFDLKKGETLWELVINKVGVSYDKRPYGEPLNHSSKRQFYIRPNIHTSLLDMVLWCIEKGYIE